jgi:hypothetical protein
MMAQRYPEKYDGILDACPAINWPSFIVAEYWGQLVMSHLDVCPSQCKLQQQLSSLVILWMVLLTASLLCLDRVILIRIV